MFFLKKIIEVIKEKLNKFMEKFFENELKIYIAIISYLY